MPKKPAKKKPIQLTPDVLKNLDQDSLVSLILKLYEQNVQLSEQLQALVAEKYGRKTERFDDPNQLRIGEVAGTTLEAEQLQKEVEADKPPKRKGHTRNPMPSHLECRKLDRKPSKEELACPCGGQRVKVNEVVRNSRYECIPVTFVREEIIDTVWQCSDCHSSIVVESDAFETIENGTAGPLLQIKTAEDRFVNHQPLHRQEQIFARQGLPINRSTICGWHASLAESLRPLYCGMHIDLLKSEVIGTDDTPVKVQDRKKKQNIKRGHEWICIGDKNHPVNMFFYTHGRGRDGPKRFLHGFTGYLLGDCFSGNRALCAETGATFVACLAHARRYFQKALPNNRPAAEEALRMFGELFKIESDAKDWEISAEMVARLRQEEAVPVLNKLKAWLDVQVLSAVPKSSLGKAVSYCLNNWDFLNNYLLDGNARIDNNLSEQQMKKVAIGRKNWYFFGSDEGGEHASILLSIFSTALRHGLRPSEYIYDVLQKLRKDRNCDIEPLLAHNWKANREKAEIEGFQATPQMAF